LPRTRREIIQAGLGAVVVLAAFLPVILGTLDKDAGHAANFMILFYGRSPQHFAMHFSDLKTHAGGLHLFAALGILAFTIRSREVRLKVLTLAGSIAVLFLLGYLLLEVWYTPVFVRMFAYRALPLLMVLNSCMIASVLLTNSPSRRELGVVALIALSSLAFEFTLVVSLALLAAAAVLLCARQIDGPAAPREARTATLVVCGAGALAVLFTKFLYPPVYFPDWPRPADRVLATALDKHTPEDSIIVVPPWLSGLRITSERAIVVNLKNFPIFGPEMAEWADRMRDVSGVDPRRAKQHLQMGKQIWQLYHQGYHARSFKDLVMAAHKYEARFILVSTNSRFHWEAGQFHVPAIWSGNGYALYETRQGVV